MKRFFFFLFLLFNITKLFSQPEIWGTVSNGGYNGNCGYIFKTDSIGDNLSIVHSFDSIQGFNPGALLAASNNKLYGLTSSGGVYGSLFDGGVFYEYDLSTSTYTVIESFGAGNPNISGYRPDGDGMNALTEVSPGIIWGYIRSDYQGSRVFEYNANTQTLQGILLLPTFQGGTWNQTQGNRLTGNLFKAPDGYLYGSTHTNSTCPIPNPQLGSIIRIDPVTHAFSIRYLAGCLATPGILVNNQFTTYSNLLYSTTRQGGASGNGVIYSFNPATSTYTKLYDFPGGAGGRYPNPMVEAENGKFYGLADGGASEPNLPQGGGILYEFDPATNVTTKKYDFLYGNGWVGNVGPFPFSLISGHNGKLYGVTPGNGVFEYDPVLNTTRAAGRMPINMGWYVAGTPSVTYVCRKPSYISLNDTIYICEGENINLEFISANTDTYTWNQNGSPFLSDTSGALSINNATVANSGAWVCEMTNVCGTTFSHSIQVIVTDGNMSVSQNVNFLQSSPADSYQWIDCDNGNAALPGQTNPTFTPFANGNYAVIGSTGLCTDTSSCFSFAGMGIEGISPDLVSVFPNPATGFIQLKNETGLTIESIIITDISGQQVLTSTQKLIDISNLPAGNYFVKVLSANGIYNTRFTKAK